MFYCPICNYKTDIKQSFSRHLSTEKHKSQCSSTTGTNGNERTRMGTNGNKREQKVANNYDFVSYSVKSKKRLSNEDKFKMIIDKLKKFSRQEKYICNFCELEFKSKKVFRNHLLKDCLIIPEIYKNKLLEKHNKNKNTKNKLEVSSLENKKNVHITNNITNNNLNNFNNNINNNIQQINFDANKHIQINPMFYETMKHITENDAIDIIQGKIEVYELFLNKLYDFTGNRNVFIADKREKIIKYLDRNGKLRSTDANRFISKMVNFNMYRIEELLEDFKTKLTPKTFKIVKTLYDKYHENDEEVCRELDKQTYIKILDISEMNKKNFENMFKIQDMNSGKEMIVVEVECVK